MLREFVNPSTRNSTSDAKFLLIEGSYTTIRRRSKFKVHEREGFKPNRP